MMVNNIIFVLPVNNYVIHILFIFIIIEYIYDMVNYSNNYIISKNIKLVKS